MPKFISEQERWPWAGGWRLVGCFSVPPPPPQTHTLSPPPLGWQWGVEANSPRGLGQVARMGMAGQPSAASRAVAPKQHDSSLKARKLRGLRGPRMRPGSRGGQRGRGTRGLQARTASTPASSLLRPGSLPKPLPQNPHPPTPPARAVKGKGKAIAPKERRGKGGNKCPNEPVSTLQASFDK